jgi:hypothetical protein
MFVLRTLSSRLHHVAPSSYSRIFLVTTSNHVRFKHKSVGSSGGASMYHPRSGHRESGNTHHGKTESEVQQHYDDSHESNKLLEDK